MLLTVAGLHVPVTPLFDVVGNTGAVEPLHTGAGVVKPGTVRGVTVTISVVVVAQRVPVGVNV